ncbi:MAG TPA: sigma-54-dependent Fis family transcriptional regulator [Polyangia bacterium]|jgi:Nif-specific regulatory protein
MEGGPAVHGADGLRKERDLYRRLLELGTYREVQPFLEEALALLVDLAGARRGSLELRERPEPDGEPSFFIARGLDPGDSSLLFSRSVVAEAIATGETIVTASARVDPRFEHAGSVRSHALEAVLCVPIGRNPVLGILYLQDRLEPGPFTSDDRARTEMFANHAAVLAERLLLRLRRSAAADPTQEYRRMLKADSIIGVSGAVADLLKQVALVAPRNISVLITGPSGSGKTQLARVIHDNSPRVAGPFVELNCGALPADLIENELFGSVPGAHSAAGRGTLGKVAAAEGGTLFLDEIGDLPARAQASLLQMLQSKVYFPLGGTASRTANVRVLTATNADLETAVAERRFREDLYYRLNVFPIRVPGLQERRADIPLLAEHFCRVACETNDLPRLELSLSALQAAEAADWSGEIRELANTIQAGAVRAFGERAPLIERQHLFPTDGTPSGAPGSDDVSFHAATRRFQRELVRRALDQTGGNVAATARLLQITRAHTYNLLATFGLRRGDAGAGPAGP